MRSWALAAILPAIVLSAGLSGIFLPISDAPGVSSARFVLDDSLTEVSNPYGMNEKGQTEMNIDKSRKTAYWHHCCDGGEWEVDHAWKVPNELVPGETAAVEIGLSVVDSQPHGEPRYFQMTMRAPDFARSVGAQYPDQRGANETFYFPISAGYENAGELKIEIQVAAAVVTYHYKRIANPCYRGPTARAAAFNEVRVTFVSGDVETHRADAPEGTWCPVTKDMVLKAGDEISVSPDGEVVLAFADNSTVTLKGGPTQLKIASFFTEGGVVRTEILLKMGEVAAQVHKSEATKSDMRIKNPTLTASVRGTKFAVFYDPGSKTSLTSVTEGVVEVDPKKAGLKTVAVRAGKEVEVGTKSMTNVVGLGKAGARKGNNRREALDRVSAVIAKGDDPCGVTTPRTGATAIKPDPKGWAVSVKLIGDRKGTSKWLVARKKVTPLNRLAKQVKKRCG